MKTKQIQVKGETFNLPVYELPSGDYIMAGPVSGNLAALCGLSYQPFDQPACLVNFNEAQDIAAKMGGRLPTEDEWMFAFAQAPFTGYLLEWTLTRSQGFYVLRGGSWLDDCPASLRCAHRRLGTPGARYVFVGFRCVFPVSGQFRPD